MHKKNKGFTLVEVLIAMVLLCLVILFVTQLWLKLINASRLAETTVDVSITSSALLQQIQEVFMQGEKLQTAGNKVIILTAEKPRSFEIVNNTLFLDDKPLTNLIRGSITVENNYASFELVLPSKRVIQTTFYVLGGQNEETSIQ